MRLYLPVMLADGRVRVTFPPRPHDQQVLPPVAPFFDLRTEPKPRAKHHRCRREVAQLEFHQFRGRWPWKSKTKPMRPLTRREKKQGRSLGYWMRVAAKERPKTRGECPVTRPCPFVSCQFHLLTDVSPFSGSIKQNFPLQPPKERPGALALPEAPRIEIDEALRLMRETCALDVADRGGVTLEEVGVLLNVSMERARQIEQMAAEKIDAELNRRKLDEKFGTDEVDEMRVRAEQEGDEEDSGW